MTALADIKAKSSEVRDLIDFVGSKEATKLSTERLEQIRDTIRDHRIELLDQISDHPGEYYGAKGASPRQIEFRDKFFSSYVDGEGPERVFAASGSNQCLADGTLVATPSGPTRIEDLNPGSIVYAGDGTPTRVLKVHDNGVRNVDRITNRGITWACATSDHKFVRRKNSSCRSHLRPLPAKCQVARTEVDTPMGSKDEPHAYTLGVLLGDGCSTCAGRLVYLSSGTTEIPDALGAEKCNGRNYSYKMRFSHPLYDAWCNGRKAHEKTIDLDVIRGWNRSSIVALIAGIIDSDGSVFVDRWDNITISVGMQARDVIEALQWAFLALWQTPVEIYEGLRDKYVNGPMYSVKVASNAFSKRILRETSPYMNVEKKRWRPEYEHLDSRRSDSGWIGVVHTPADSVPTYDITIEHPSHVFLLANGLQTANSGKTECIGGMIACRYIRDYAKDGDVFWVLAGSHDTLRDIPQKTLWKYLPRSMFPAKLEYNPRLGFGQIPTLQLTLPDGRGKCEIWFKTEEMDLGMLESARIKGFWWTECNKESIFGAVQPRLAANRGFLLMDYVPTQGWHKFRVKIPAESGENPYIYHSRFCMRENAHNLAEGEIEYQRAMMTEEEALIRIDGKDGAAFGAVYKEFDPSLHVVEDFTPPPDWPRWVTMDYGYRNPTAVLWVTAAPPGWELPDGRTLPHGGLIVYREYYVRERTVEENARNILRLMEGETYEKPPCIDPTAFQVNQANGKSIAQEYREAGLPVRPGIKVNKYGNQAMVENVRRLLQSDQLFFLRSCSNAIKEHQVWRYKENREGLPLPDEPFDKKDDHTCDALKILIAENPRYAPSLQGESYDEPDII